MKHLIPRERMAMLDLLALAASDVCDVQDSLAKAIQHELGVTDGDTHARERIMRFVHCGPLQNVEELLADLHVAVAAEATD